MSDPHESAGISVTIKQDEPGGKFNDAKSPGSWIVFHGTPAKIAEQIKEVFDLPIDGVPLYELTQQATELFKATSNVRQGLGIKTVGKTTGAAPEASQVAAEAPATQAAAPAAEDPLLAALKGAQSRAELKTLRAENQAAFNENPEYLATWKSRGKELPAGGN